MQTLAPAAGPRPGPHPALEEEGEEGVQHEPPPPPPPPLEPLLDVQAPRIVSVAPSAARVEWGQAGMAVPASEDPAQAEVQAGATYSVHTELQMQEVDLPGGAGASPEAQVAQAAALVAQGEWRTVHEAPCCSAEVRGVRTGPGRGRRARRRRGRAAPVR